MNKVKAVSVWFSAGTLGGITNAVFVWGTGACGVNALLGIQITPQWSPAFLYQRMVWGGIWGFMFALPYLKKSIWRRGFLFGLAPTLAVLTVVLPFQLNKGMFGLGLGSLVPVFAVMANAIWGITAAWWVEKAEK